MIVVTTLKFLDCIERSLEEQQKDPTGPKYTGSISFKKSKKTKTGTRLEVEDLQSYKSHEKVSAGEHLAEIEISAYAVNGNSGLSIRVIKIVKPAKI